MAEAKETLSQIARRIGIGPGELAAVIECGSSVAYQPDVHLFHE